MAKFCAIVGIVWLVASILVSLGTNLIAGATILPGALVLLVLAKHLDNQEEIIKAIKATACPQLYYISKFAPKLIVRVIANDSPELADADITISNPRLTSDGSFRIAGSVARKRGLVARSSNFVAEYAPGEYYHRQQDWLLTHFEWV